ncbi:MAG: AmmeMemoRadiSam system protein B [Pseudomonadota bacterium]
MIRKPAVAGRFYPDNPSVLSQEVRSYLLPQSDKRDALGVVSPHAGYIYSGHVAGAVFSGIRIPDTVVILGPNHRGIGSGLAMMADGIWEMPNGNVPVNAKLASLVGRHSSHITDDHRAHVYEHSLEVQLPFLQALKKSFTIVPIAVSHAGWRVCKEVGEGLASAIMEYGEKVLVVASSDMTHYESDQSARNKDRIAIDRILALDPEGLLEEVRMHEISMCGVIPAAMMLAACKKLGATRAELVKYATSGETSGDYAHVVGYAGLYIE